MARGRRRSRRRRRRRKRKRRRGWKGAHLAVFKHCVEVINLSAAFTSLPPSASPLPLPLFFIVMIVVIFQYNF